MSPMSEANTDFLDPDLVREAEATAQRPALSDAGEHLPTTRLPSITPPSPAAAKENLSTAAIPPLPSSFVPPPVAPSARSSSAPPAASPAAARAAAAADVSMYEATTSFRHEPAPPAPVAKPSWLKSLLASTFPPPAPVPGEHAALAVRRRLVVACVGFAVFFAVLALITGLRGAPVDPTLSPMVAAAIVVGRALVAVGAGAFSYGLLRIAERLGTTR